MSVNQDLVRYRLEKAKETLEDAELLLSKNRLSSAVNRLYYSLFYGVLALLETKGLASSKHAGVRALFNQHFVKNGIVSKELGQFYGELFNERQEGDYVDYTEFAREKVVEDMKKCQTFLVELEQVVDMLLRKETEQ